MKQDISPTSSCIINITWLNALRVHRDVHFCFTFAFVVESFMIIVVAAAVVVVVGVRRQSGRWNNVTENKQE